MVLDANLSHNHHDRSPCVPGKLQRGCGLNGDILLDVSSLPTTDHSFQRLLFLQPVCVLGPSRERGGSRLLFSQHREIQTFRVPEFDSWPEASPRDPSWTQAKRITLPDRSMLPYYLVLERRCPICEISPSSVSRSGRDKLSIQRQLSCWPS